MNHKVSINISCYNRSAMLRECIDSFVRQTYKNWELIIVDDGSTEDLSFVTDIDQRIRYYRQEHGGMAKGLNLAVTKSFGFYIMPFGSDDIALPNLLERTVEILDDNKNIDVVYTDGWVVRQDGRKSKKKHPEYYTQNKVYTKMLEKQYISHGGTLWRREKYPLYDETVGSAEDLEFFLTAIENGTKFKLLPERLWLYRVGYKRESKSDSQNNGCIKVLSRRGYNFDINTRRGHKICQ